MKFKAILVWTSYKEVEVEAENEEAALELLYAEDLGDGIYMEDSFRVEDLEATND